MLIGTVTAFYKTGVDILQRLITLKIIQSGWANEFIKDRLMGQKQYTVGCVPLYVRNLNKASILSTIFWPFSTEFK